MTLILPQPKRYDQRHPRSGFTLVELLVVIAILIVLISLLSSGAMKFIATQRYNNSIDRVDTIYALLQKEWEKVVAEARKEEPSKAVIELAGGNRKRAQVIWIKLRLMEAFPQNFAEIENAPLYQPNLLYQGSPPLIPEGRRKYLVRYFEQIKNRVPTNTNNPAKMDEGVAGQFDTMPAACLLLALRKSQGSTLSEIEGYEADFDEDGVRELVDDWGRPLGFFRFPTLNQDLLKTKKTSVVDVLDPDGYLTSPNWNNDLRALFEKLVYDPTIDLTKPLPPRNYYIVPVVTSAGEDAQMSLAPYTMQVTNAVQARDNIYSFRE